MAGSDQPPPKRQKLSESPGVQPASISPASSDSKLDQFGWAVCSGSADAERLATKEKAVEQAQESCGKLAVMLKSAIEGIQSDSEDAAVMGLNLIKQWLSDHDRILAQHRDYGVLVGVEGPTGAGKSSFLGSLLRIQELLPSGQESAATAVVGKVSWNFDDTPGHEYRAEIIFRRKKDVEEDLAESAKERGRHQRVRRLRKGCERFSDDMKEAVKRIIDSNPTALDFMEQGTRQLYISKPEELSMAIKPFLDSTKNDHGDGKAFAAWPLVEMVNIFVKADILKTGIHLVDLPGCGDAVDSRAEIAQRFRENLDVRMIVSPICRAADEKQGKSLMRNGYEEAQMMLNGKLNSRGLCVVLSKIDDITADTYIKGIPELRRNTGIAQKQARLSSLRKEMEGIDTTYTTLQKEKWRAEVHSQEAIVSHEKAIKRVSKHPTDEVPHHIAQRAHEAERAKFKSMEALEEATNALRGFDDKKRGMKREIENLDSWLHHQAILARNGHKFTSKGSGITYTWLENLVAPLLASIAKEWDKKLNKYLTGLKTPIMKEFSEVWEGYLDSLIFSIHKCIPLLEPEFAKILPSLKNIENIVKSNITKILGGLSKEASQAHPKVTTVLQRRLAPTFMKALGFRSLGMHKERQDLILKKIVSGVKPMHIKVITSLEAELDAKKETMPSKMDSIASQAIKDAKTQVACLLNNLLENDAEGTTIQGRKGALHKSIRKLLMEWESQWRFHRHSGDHILLLKNLSIPKDLDDVPIKKEDEENQMYEWHAEDSD
ncbi:hypothetical protein QQX98_000257 [Neonectria punicea]|uniref:Dynamin N-terminal domain-containing protein n=1 Tax=Neonectria punicea TaxID=979145 RepID=A0ABR1HVM6_9HYPO